MGHNHWKVADKKTHTYGRHEVITIGLFTRCHYSNTTKEETCIPNLYPKNTTCSYGDCESSNPQENCNCDYTPSTKGIAACAIIASIFLGSALIILFIHSIGSTKSRVIEMLLGYLPLIQLLLAFIFILITLILVGSYLSRDFMHIVRPHNNDSNIETFRDKAKDDYDIRIGWTTGLEIIGLVFTFFALIVYCIYAFVLGRST